MLANMALAGFVLAIGLSIIGATVYGEKRFFDDSYCATACKMIINLCGSVLMLIGGLIAAISILSEFDDCY